MRRDLSRLRIEKLIVHEVPTKKIDVEQQLVFSEVESSLTQDNKNYFRERIVDSLGSAAYDVTFDPNSSSPIPQLVLNNLSAQQSDFLTMSMEMTQHLYNCQTRVNPSGLLAVVQASIESFRAFVVLKLEREEGVRVKQDKNNGKRTFSIEHLSDLMLTGKTKVFKIGLFVQTETTLESIEGAVSDKQRSFQPNTEVADFFLKKFLGCKLREAPEITTKRFLQATEEFINKRVAEPAIKARYEIALLATINSQQGTLHPKTFAEGHLDINHRQQYIDFLEKSQILIQEFDKDVALVKTHTNKIKMELESGLAILGSPSVFDERVKITDNKDNEHIRIVIEDKLKNIHGK